MNRVTRKLLDDLRLLADWLDEQALDEENDYGQLVVKANLVRKAMDAIEAAA